METRQSFSRYIFPVLLAIGAAAGSCFAQASSTALPDDQVEANVLRSLTSAAELTSEGINTATAGGTVTLSGSVHTEAQRRRAEQLVSTTPGVRRVIDELTVSGVSFSETKAQSASGKNDTAGRILQSDGTYAPVSGDEETVNRSHIQSDQQAAEVQQNGSVAQQQLQEVPPPNGPDTDPYGHPLDPQSAGTSQPSYRGYPNPQATGGAGYAQPTVPSPPYGQNYGQPGGQAVTVPSGTLLRVRVNQHLNSRDINVGTPFDAMVESDIVADGQVAIPRGAFVQGTVVDAENSGRLKGRGELGLRLTQVTLGGKVYPIASDVFSAHGGDKSIQTVNSALGLGALGAIFGAIAGGGAGAAIGAGVGGAAGIGASAASGRGDVFIPSEAVLSFRLTQPASVTTVSQAEMQRLAYSAPQGRPQSGPQFSRRRFPYPYPYFYGPVYYGPRFYRPYGFYPY